MVFLAAGVDAPYTSAPFLWRVAGSHVYHHVLG
jgi:hypothetical protein